MSQARDAVVIFILLELYFFHLAILLHFVILSVSEESRTPAFERDCVKSA